jgi:uncharacterized lipoprotein YbaY
MGAAVSGRITMGGHLLFAIQPRRTVDAANGQRQTIETDTEVNTRERV